MQRLLRRIMHVHGKHFLMTFLMILNDILCKFHLVFKKHQTILKRNPTSKAWFTLVVRIGNFLLLAFVNEY